MPMRDALIDRPVWEQNGGPGGPGTTQSAGEIGVANTANAIGAMQSPAGMVGLGGMPMGFGTAMNFFGGQDLGAAQDTFKGFSPTQQVSMSHQMTPAGLQAMGLQAPPGFDPAAAQQAFNQQFADAHSASMSATGADIGDPGFGGTAPGAPGGEFSGGMDANGMDGDTSGSAGGYYNGGMVTPARMVGPDPAGPDEGYAAVQADEYILNKKITKKLGPKGLKMLQALSQ